MKSILEENQIDTVIHFAADCTSTRCYNETIEAIENNVIAFIEFLEVYGDSGLGEDEAGKVEESRLLPGNPYAATKVNVSPIFHGQIKNKSVCQHYTRQLLK
ncbi:hypothetical protein COOONC_27994 [Cooperia oncophora]